MDPVIVVGAGPVGLSLSLALAGSGVPCVVLDEGPGKDEPRPARTVALHADTAAMVHRLGCTTLRDEGAYFAAWRTMRRGRDTHRITFEDQPAPLHLPQHALARGLRDAAAAHPLVQLITDSKLDSLEQDGRGVTAHTRGAETTWWRGSFLVGCDGARSTVRKLLGIRFPGRTAVERHAVAALRTDLPWPGEALLHRSPPEEVTARPLPDGVWRLDWLLPPRGELVTPDALLTLVRDTLAGWYGGTTPPYDLLDTGVYTLHHRLARRWRDRRAFLAGDAAHLLGALGTQGVEEGLRDAENLAWKLALAWHQGASEALLDSYEGERRRAVAARLRAADQAVPALRSGSGLRTYLPGASRSAEALLTDGHLGRGPLGVAPAYAPPVAVREVPTATEPGGPVANVPVTAPDGSTVPLRDLLGRGRLLVLLVAPGTGVWDRRHWMGAGLMPRLAAAVSALPVRSELLVADGYPGAPAHTVLLVRPDGHLAATFAGVRPAELYEAADTVRMGAPEPASAKAPPAKTPSTAPTAVID
ncbi:MULTISPECIES: NAD(P)/FAD-dependent oxidoreductase [unclassified Streptomyces]|uniref:FAD-dependent oxidoreductase n=1 Tax=unclassified Streptomyces TaxID=2593676 RepID=UPI001BE54BEC|nr:MULTISPECIES: FAD-dependent monooxygenase [unclassified Streptomyces]MBT2404282.1 FAD-dependent monooxygenase [Streptomyces sp. ISL-21]MBT2611989.1 FAD-dependent monooxygenase [Streptomyces sp. ISL-87]